ncbi:MAG: hypothetical protein KDB14_11460 [Planctomycetales bacterium]|nr:hypothetical protein [Planctomycetales bacterium]
MRATIARPAASAPAPSKALGYFEADHEASYPGWLASMSRPFQDYAEASALCEVDLAVDAGRGGRPSGDRAGR